MEAREKFRLELTTINEKVKAMAELVIEQLHRGLIAIENNDLELAERVIAQDMEVDKFQMAIDDACVRLIAIEQPVAGDLREIVSCIKIVSNIARIGDHAKHLAKGSKRISDTGRKNFLPDIKEMAERGIHMLEIAIKAFVLRDELLAKEVASLDNEIDDLRKTVSSKIITFMQSSPSYIEEGASLLFLNRFMERLGDHVTNLCEWVYFARTGKHIELN